MKKDAFLIGLFIGSGLTLGTKITEKAIQCLPVGINYIKGILGKVTEKKKDDGFEDVK